MSEFTLNAQLRTDLGKGASRRLRRNANLVPAVIYGAEKEATSISIEEREIAKLLLNDACYSSILTINLDGKRRRDDERPAAPPVRVSYCMPTLSASLPARS